MVIHLSCNECTFNVKTTLILDALQKIYLYDLLVVVFFINQQEHFYSVSETICVIIRFNSCYHCPYC